MTPFFTIFTPTYNRKHTLPRLIESLKKAGDASFEWVVIDDGSTDGTYEWLLDQCSRLDFPTIIHRKPNGGKLSCHNAALSLANGLLMVILDSDDELAPQALDVLKSGWETIPKLKRSQFAGILGNSIDAGGRLVGEVFPQSPLDGRHLQLVLDNAMVGEKLPCYRIDVLKMFPFPDNGARAVIPEGLIWNRISVEYMTRCINEIVRVYHRDVNDSNSLMNSYVDPSSNAYGKFLYFREVVKFSKIFSMSLKQKLMYSLLQFRYGLHAEISMRELIGPPRFFAFACLLGGALLWGSDKIRMRSRTFKPR